jgi:hypothetical protein
MLEVVNSIHTHTKKYALTHTHTHTHTHTLFLSLSLSHTHTHAYQEQDSEDHGENGEHLCVTGMLHRCHRGAAGVLHRYRGMLQV